MGQLPISKDWAFLLIFILAAGIVVGIFYLSQSGPTVAHNSVLATNTSTDWFSLSCAELKAEAYAYADNAPNANNLVAAGYGNGANYWSEALFFATLYYDNGCAANATATQG